MNIVLPGFEKSLCRIVSVCGELIGFPGTEPSSIEERTARFGGTGRRAVVRAFIHGNEDKKFLHVDIALRASFGKTKEPKITHRKEEVLDTIRQASGADLDGSITAGFLTTLSALPEDGLVRALCRERTAGEASIKMVSGEYSLTGAPFSSIRWVLVGAKSGDDRSIYIVVNRPLRTKIGGRYIMDALETTETLFRSFLMEERSAAHV